MVKEHCLKIKLLNCFFLLAEQLLYQTGCYLYKLGNALTKGWPAKLEGVFQLKRIKLNF